MKPRHQRKYRYFLQDSPKMSQSNRHIFYSQITISEHLFLHYSVFIYCIYRDLWQVKIGQMIDLTRSTHFTIQAKKICTEVLQTYDTFWTLKPESVQKQHVIIWWQSGKWFGNPLLAKPHLYECFVTNCIIGKNPLLQNQNKTENVNWGPR